MSYINFLDSQWHDAHIVNSYYSDTLYEVVIMSGAIFNASYIYSLKQFFLCIGLIKNPLVYNKHNLFIKSINGYYTGLLSSLPTKLNSTLRFLTIT